MKREVERRGEGRGEKRSRRGRGRGEEGMTWEEREENRT